MAAIKNIAVQERVAVINEDLASNSKKLEEEDEDVSLCDLPVNLIKPDQTQFSTTKSGPARVKIETQDQEFDFGSSMLGGANFLADTKMCSADEVFFQGQIVPLRLSVSSDTGFNGLARKYSLSGVGLRSNSCRSRISHNSSFSSNSSSTTTTTTAAATGIASKSNPRNPRGPRNQFYTEPSPKPQIRTPNARLEKMGGRSHKSSVWDFFRSGLVRTPDMELQDVNKVLRSNSSTIKSSVSRNSSVTSSTNSTNFIANFNNVASVSSGLKLDNEKQKKHSFFSSVHGCKCSFEMVAVDNVIIKSRSWSSGGSSSTNHINESGRAAEATHAMVKEKVEIELKMKKNNEQKKSKKQKKKQAMSHHRTYEWLKELSHANSPSPVHD